MQTFTPITSMPCVSQIIWEFPGYRPNLLVFRLPDKYEIHFSDIIWLVFVLELTELCFLDPKIVTVLGSRR